MNTPFFPTKTATLVHADNAAVNRFGVNTYSVVGDVETERLCLSKKREDCCTYMHMANIPRRSFNLSSSKIIQILRFCTKVAHTIKFCWEEIWLLPVINKLVSEVIK